ncbi:hypothetical protein [Roseobacter sp. MH60115]|uniref:hypothetical protein n=1 Tax=Roseobacter sp. MH60115 TaxID=2785324 RepID=UPI001E59E78F|nr:hypothetical protein [Roseobacter sp. MH60115]
MSNNDRNDDRLSPTRSRRPDMLGDTVKEFGDGKRSSWSKVAAAWAHKDGKGFEIRMDAMPVDGRLVLRAASDDRQDDDLVHDPK